MATNFKLYYFDIHGRAEPLRAMFVVADRKYEDIRLNEEWLEVKPQTPFGQIPMLEVDGKRYAQTVALATYLSHELGLAGKNNLENLRIGEVFQLWSDLMNFHDHAFYKGQIDLAKERLAAKTKETGKEYSEKEYEDMKRDIAFEMFAHVDEVEKFESYLDTELYTELKQKTIPKYFGYFEKFLADSGTGFIVGDTLTAADIFVLDIFTGFYKPILENDKPDSTKFPLLAKFVDAVLKDPKVSQYMKNRPKRTM